MHNTFLLIVLFSVSSMAFIPPKVQTRPTVTYRNELHEHAFPLNNQLLAIRKIYKHLKTKKQIDRLKTSIEKFNTLLP